MGKKNSVEKLLADVDAQAIISESGKFARNYFRLSNKGNKRSGVERRNFKYTAFIPERRSGEERRKKDSDWTRQKQALKTSGGSYLTWMQFSVFDILAISTSPQAFQPNSSCSLTSMRRPPGLLVQAGFELKPNVNANLRHTRTSPGFKRNMDHLGNLGNVTVTHRLKKFYLSVRALVCRMKLLDTSEILACPLLRQGLLRGC